MFATVVTLEFISHSFLVLATTTSIFAMTDPHFSNWQQTYSLAFNFCLLPLSLFRHISSSNERGESNHSCVTLGGSSDSSKYAALLILKIPRQRVVSCCVTQQPSNWSTNPCSSCAPCQGNFFLLSLSLSLSLPLSQSPVSPPPLPTNFVSSFSISRFLSLSLPPFPVLRSLEKFSLSHNVHLLFGSPNFTWHEATLSLPFPLASPSSLV